MSDDPTKIAAALTEEQRQLLLLCAPLRSGVLRERIGREALVRLPVSLLKVREEWRRTPKGTSILGPVYRLSSLGAEVRATMVPPSPEHRLREIEAAARRAVSAWRDRINAGSGLHDAMEDLRAVLVRHRIATTK